MDIPPDEPPELPPDCWLLVLTAQPLMAIAIAALNTTRGVFEELD